MLPDAPDALAAASPGAGDPSRTAAGPAPRAQPVARPGTSRSAGGVRRALAPIEFTFDLRQTPAENVVGRVFAALDRVAQDVTLLVILRDVPEMAGVTANVVALLGRSGYQSDMARLPGGGQRMRIRSRNRPREVPGAANGNGEARLPDGAPDPVPPGEPNGDQ